MERAAVFTHAEPGVVCRNVGYAYAPGRALALRDVSFAVPPGAAVGVYGSHGSGRSTLLRLLVRRFDPGIGTISLHGTDLRDFSIAELRRRISFVPRRPLLFSGSVADNIAYSRLAVSPQQIVAAARAVNIHHLIMRNPQGYQVQIGERGCRLTGTQRQLIALAREYLKNPALIVFDDPMIMAGDGIENDVAHAIRRLGAGRITFIASERLQTLAHCDLILSIEHGRLASVDADMAAAASARHGWPARDGAGRGSGSVEGPRRD